MITIKDIEDKIKEYQVPHNAVFSEVHKKLAWGADRILESMYLGWLDDKWLYFSADLNCDEYANLCKKLAENEHVCVFYVNGARYGHLSFKILGDESFVNEIELLGGLENYAKMGG